MTEESKYPFTEYGQGFAIWPPARGKARVTIYRASWLAKRAGRCLVWVGEPLQRIGDWTEGVGLDVRRGKAVGTEEIDLAERLKATQERMSADMLNLFDGP